MQTDYQNKMGPGTMKTVRIRNESRVTLHGVKPGDHVDVPVDGEGTPLDRDWRRRLKDAKADGCCRTVPEDEINPPQPAPQPAPAEPAPVEEADEDTAAADKAPARNTRKKV